MGSASLLIVIITALTTWIFSIFVLSSRYPARLGHDVVHVASAFGWNPAGVVLQSANNLDHHDDVAPMQGGNGTFKKKLRSYINMTDYAGPSTVWKVYPHKFPCVDGAAESHMLTTPAHEGILFQRPVKTGSTTMTSIILRLIQRYATTGIKRCKYRAMHATSRQLEFGHRNPDKSYLVSVVRDPTLKAISRFFHFDVSIGQKVPTDAYFQMIMGRPYNQNDMTMQLITRDDAKPLLNSTQVVQDILGTCLSRKWHNSLDPKSSIPRTMPPEFGVPSLSRTHTLVLTHLVSLAVKQMITILLLLQNEWTKAWSCGKYFSISISMTFCTSRLDQRVPFPTDLARRDDPASTWFHHF